jgi:N-acetylated-alpha-linked acidic dipeptidase
LREFVTEIQKKKGAKENLDLKPVMESIDQFEAEGRALNQAVEEKLNSNSSDAFDALNASVISLERNWLNPEGIPGRPWFKHMLYAARYTYAHLELPGLSEAVEKGDWKTAREQTQILESATKKNAALLKASAAALTNSSSTSAGTH